MAIHSHAVLKPHLRLLNEKLPPFPGKACKVSFQKSPFVSTSLYTPGWRRLVASAFPDKNNGQENESHGAKHKESSGYNVATTVEKPAEDNTILGLKKALIDSAFGTERGLLANSEIRAEIIELINQLEAKNPTPAPTDALQLLNGKWILVYTSWSELFPLLAAGISPLVKVGEISQTIDAKAFTAQNSVTLAGLYASTAFSTRASFEVRSPHRVQIKFEEGIIGTPQLIDSIVVPEHFVLMGQKIDLSPIQGILRPLQEAASSVARSLNARAPLKFPIQTESAQSWLITTYLDHDLRISRGDGGSVFILLKDGSRLLET